MTTLILLAYSIVGLLAARHVAVKGRPWAENRHNEFCIVARRQKYPALYRNRAVECGCWRGFPGLGAAAIGAFLLWPIAVLGWFVFRSSRRPLANADWIERTEQELGIGGDQPKGLR